MNEKLLDLKLIVPEAATRAFVGLCERAGGALDLASAEALRVAWWDGLRTGLLIAGLIATVILALRK